MWVHHRGEEPVMAFKKLTSFVFTFICLVLLTASCSEEVVYRHPAPSRGYGPPSHAPAYGRRAKQVEGVELVYDAGLGLYVVVGRTDYYYCDGTFYRLQAGLWQVSPSPNHGWGPLGKKVLPSGLVGKGNGKIKIQTTSQGRNKGRGHGNFKKAS
jgi:hypothetical protein